jgi:Phosphodiester glycosidase
LLCLGVLVASGMLAVPSGPAARALPRFKQWVTPVANGLTLTAILDRFGPTRVRVLEIDPGTKLTVDVALQGDLLPGLGTTSSMSREHDALAAVNGDFYFPSGQPTHPFAEDGALVQTSTVWGQNFAISADELDVFVRHPFIDVGAVEVDGGGTWPVSRWNFGVPQAGDIAAYTPSGGSSAKPPTDSCAARLFPSATEPRVWASGQMGVTEAYVVDVVRCWDIPLGTAGGLVLATPQGIEPSAALISALVPGETVDITWSFGWRGVLDGIGGLPLLVKDGQIVATDCPTSFCDRHPRTGVGVRADGTLLFVTVDGRQPKYSVGMTLVEFAEQFRRLGAMQAMNLDGGGSTTMVVNDKVVNRPSDPGGERKVSTALLVLPGADPGEIPPPLLGGVPGSMGMLGSAAGDPLTALSFEKPGTGPGRTAALDPASVGGMLDALARGFLGGPDRPLPPEARRVLGLFRGSS